MVGMVYNHIRYNYKSLTWMLISFLDVQKEILNLIFLLSVPLARNPVVRKGGRFTDKPSVAAFPSNLKVKCMESQEIYHWPLYSAHVMCTVYNHSATS